MWLLSDKPCRWIWLGAGSDGLAVQHGVAGDPRPVHARTIAAGAWRPVWRRYRAASDALPAPVTFQGDAANTVAAAHREMSAACRAVYALVAEAAASDLGSERFVAARGPGLPGLSLARLVAVARPDLCAARRLPWDVPPGLTAGAAAQLACSVPGRRLPRIADLAILAPVDQALERAFVGAHGDTGLANAWIATWLVDLERALAQLRRAGARVLRPATATDFLAAVDGHHGECLQLIAHTDERSGEVYFDRSRLQLGALADQIRIAVAAGWRSSVQAVDLATCRAEGALARALRDAGIEYVNGRPGELHPGAIARWLGAIGERGLLDGQTPFAHAWLLAAMEEAPQ